MHNNLVYISLGPWCHAASILKDCRLRTCSFPFDWCQSGSIQHGEVLEISSHEYYYRHIHNPTIHCEYIATTKPDENGHKEGFLRPRKPIYGHNFFYNPHRDPGEEKDYFLRCLKRLKAVCQNSKIRKIFFIADYIEKPGNTFLDNYADVESLIQERIIKKVSGKSILCIHRTKVSGGILATNSTHRINSNSYLVLEEVPTAIEYEAQCSNNSLAKKVLISLRRSVLDKELPRKLSEALNSD